MYSVVKILKLEELWPNIIELYTLAAVLNEDVSPPRATLTYFVNLYPQTLSCPLEFCTYEKKSCKDVMSIVNHFRKSHPCFHLYVNYHCQIPRQSPFSLLMMILLTYSSRLSIQPTQSTLTSLLLPNALLNYLITTSNNTTPQQCVQFATAARKLASDLRKPKNPNNAGIEMAPRPPPHRPPAGRPISRFDPTEARRIQGLYRHSKKRAARKLMNDNVVTYSGTFQQAETYFTEIFEEKRANPSVLGEGLNTYVPNAKDHEQSNELYDQISSREVSAKLKSAANAAPGSDRCEYSHLKKVDPGAQVLTLIFNRCHREKDFPAPWKEALTILIYKKGDEADLSR